MQHASHKPPYTDTAVLQAAVRTAADVPRRRAHYDNSPAQAGAEVPSRRAEARAELDHAGLKVNDGSSRPLRGEQVRRVGFQPGLFPDRPKAEHECSFAAGVDFLRVRCR